MADLIKALKIVKKALKSKPHKPKLTPKQFQQKAKVEMKVKKVINGTEGVDGLMKESNKLLLELAKTFITQTTRKASQSTVKREDSADSVEPDQSNDPKE